MRHKINIGMVLDGHYPADIRVRKEAESLAEHFNVFVLCVNNTNQPEFEIINKVSVFREISYNSFSHKGFIDIVLASRFLHPLFQKKLPEFVKNQHIDVLHVHDLPLAKTVVQIADKHKIKKVIDLHENYPEALKTWFSWRKSPLIRIKNRLFFNYKRWSKYEAKILPQFDTIIAVVEEMKDYLIEKNKRLASKIIVVTNTEKKSFASHYDSKTSEVFSDFKNHFIVTYIGGIGPHRGLQTAIRGVREIKKEIPNILLVMVGPTHPDVLEHLKHLVKIEEIENDVVFLGRQDFSVIPKMMQSSQVNIIPHEKNAHTDHTIPHKLYQILMSGQPLLVSDVKPLKRVVNNLEIGWIFEAGNPVDFAKKVRSIHQETDTAVRKASQGKKACLEGNLNWEHTAKTLISFYKKITT